MAQSHNLPRIVVSRCLLGKKCRYDGEVFRSDSVEELRRHVRFVPVCPEVDAGLPVPRDPMDVVDDGGKHRVMVRKTDTDLTVDMERFAQEFLDSVGEVHGFVLKAQSPSCGVGDAKLFRDGREVGRTDGLFAAAVRQRLPATWLLSEVVLAAPGGLRRLLLGLGLKP